MFVTSKAGEALFPREPELRRPRFERFAPTEIEPGIWRAFTIVVPWDAVAVPAYGVPDDGEQIVWPPSPQKETSV